MIVTKVMIKFINFEQIGEYVVLRLKDDFLSLSLLDSKG